MGFENQRRRRSLISAQGRSVSDNLGNQTTPNVETLKALAKRVLKFANAFSVSFVILLLNPGLCQPWAATSERRCSALFGVRPFGVVRRAPLRRCSALTAMLSVRGGGEVAGAGAQDHVLARGRYFDLAITIVTVFVQRIVTKQVLRAELRRDL